MILPVVWAIALVPAGAQDLRAQGIQFEQGLSWPAVRARAKATNKYVLLVAYTASCGRCAVMDRNIYSQEKIGRYLNDKFVSIKVQMDTTPHDSAAVRRWYADARTIRRRYAVATFPTFLFFSRDGKLVHRAEGAKDAEAVLAMAAEALDPATQYYTVLDRYRRGRRDPAAMRQLARTARALKDTVLAQQVAGDYIARLSDTELYARDNLAFAHAFTRSSSDPAFTLFYRQAAKVDSILGSAGASQGVVDRVIMREEIGPSLAAAQQGGPAPDWQRISAGITQKYGAEYADRTVVGAKVGWYHAQQDWPNYIPHLVTQVEKYGPRTLEGLALLWLNNSAWDVFLYSRDPAILAKALAWSERVVKADPGNASSVDTYANLLYKLGRADEAVRWQEVAVKLAPDNAEIAGALEKMKRGEPTWPSN